MIIYVTKINDLLYLHAFFAGGSLVHFLEFFRDTKKRVLFIFMIFSIIIFTLQQVVAHDLYSGIFFFFNIVLILVSVIAHNRKIEFPSILKKILKPAQFIAIISYPLYLLHQNLGYILIMWFESIGFLCGISILITMCVMIGLSYLLHLCIERTSVKLSKKTIKLLNMLVKDK